MFREPQRATLQALRVVIVAAPELLRPIQTLRHVGSNGTLGDAVSTLRRWLDSSGETPRDGPLILHRVQLFPDVPEHEALTDVMLPLASADRNFGTAVESRYG
jgi:DNA gyrase inhibitor GyrI